MGNSGRGKKLRSFRPGSASRQSHSQGALIDYRIPLCQLTGMTIALTKEVEAFVEEQVRAGVSPDAATLVNDVLRSLSEHQQRPFTTTPELEAWLLEAADSPATPLVGADFDAIRRRVRTRLGGSAA